MSLGSVLVELGGQLVGMIWDGIVSFGQSLFSGIGDFFGGLFGGGGGGDSSIPANADGTQNFGGGLTTIHERGGEIAVLPSESAVLTHSQSERLLSAQETVSSGDINISPTVTIAINGNADEKSVSDIEKKMRTLFDEWTQEAFQMMQLKHAY